MFGIIEPHSFQKLHRHQSIALDLIVDCKKGCHTLVGTELDGHNEIANPVRVDWEPGLSFVTPPGYWHAHYNETDGAGARHPAPGCRPAQLFEDTRYPLHLTVETPVMASSGLTMRQGRDTLVTGSTHGSIVALPRKSAPLWTSADGSTFGVYFSTPAQLHPRGCRQAFGRSL